MDGEPVRARLGLTDRPVVVCVSRLVPRKGQDTLIRALPAIRRRVPDAALLLVGGGPYRATLEKLARQTGVDRDVVFTGSVPWAELPAHYAAGDVFAMPCRTRTRRAGRGGAGHRLPGGVGDRAAGGGRRLRRRAGRGPRGRDRVRRAGARRRPLADRVVTLLADRTWPALGAAGRAWVEEEWRWETQARRLTDLLAGTTSPG